MRWCRNWQPSQNESLVPYTWACGFESHSPHETTRAVFKLPSVEARTDTICVFSLEGVRDGLGRLMPSPNFGVVAQWQEARPSEGW